MDGTLGISAALRPYLAQRRAASRTLAERLEEELVSFCAHRGLPVDEEAGRRIAILPASRLDPALAWDFVADHLITHLSLPVDDVCRIGRLFARALVDAAGRGLVDREHARAVADAASAAVQELPRLDQLTRTLRRGLVEGRPGRELWESDPEAYARAMERWESAQPIAREEREGGFVVVAVREHAVELRHRRREEAIELPLAGDALRLVHEGDRLDALLGCNSGGWFLVDLWAVAAPRPTP